MIIFNLYEIVLIQDYIKIIITRIHIIIIEMRNLLAIAVIFTIMLAVYGQPAISQSLTEKLKRAGTPWEVVDYEENIFKGWTIEDVKAILMTEKVPLIKADDYEEVNNFEFNPTLPENFDGRDKFGKCIHAIRDQGHCGSCWAHGASEALSDRFCIAGKDVILSPQDLVSCDPNDKGCNGGGDITPYLYMTEPGIVAESCFPYVSQKGAVPPCITHCQNNEPLVRYKCQIGSVFVKAVVLHQQDQLYYYGPLSTAFNVYQDFLYYKKGVYSHQQGDFLGGHAVKVIGWGIEEGVKYWICANSWAESWGEKGYFRIKMGDSGIMDRGVGCLARV